MNFRSYLILLLSIFGLFISSTSISAKGDKPWVQQFNPTRQFWVSSSGTGSGTSEGNPMSFSSALNSAQPGDLYWMLPGTYSGTFTISRAGTSTKPIVYRAKPGEKVTLQGSVDIKGAYTWIWGVEIKDPAGIGTEVGVALNAPGIHLINNVIYDHLDGIGIGAWNMGAGQVLYGNVIGKQISSSINPHNIYTQNDVDQNGYKYFAGNMILDAWDVTDDTFNVHAYTQNSLITGLHFEENIIANGKFLIGGYNEPADRQVVSGNYFYDSRVQFGWARPAQAKFNKNYLGRTSLFIEWFWGEGEVQFNQKKKNTFKKNEILFPTDNHIYFRTSAYLTTGRCEGCPKIRKSDKFNKNKYSAPFKATFFANNQNLGTINFAAWKSATNSAGNGFDGNSSEISPPNTPKIAVLKNDYEERRGHIVVYNWGQASSVIVNLSSILKPGDSYKIVSGRSVYGTPVLSGTYTGPVNLPMQGQEFGAFLVVAD